MSITREEAIEALKAPRPRGVRSILVKGVNLSVVALNRIVRGDPSERLPVAQATPAGPTLEELFVLRSEIRDTLDALDEQLMFIKLQEMFKVLARKMTGPVQEAADAVGRAIQNAEAAPPRPAVKTDLEKVKSDTAQALKAAQRLFSRGAL